MLFWNMVRISYGHFVSQDGDSNMASDDIYCGQTQ